ncbi:MAG TPA: allantoinase AllB [Pirellulales bacterium]|jgi:allantoinase|nr:allantoinase AllB [Pirellulales bacterium]
MMPPSDATLQRFGLASRRVVLADGVRPAVVVVTGSQITEILDDGTATDVPLEDFGDLVIAPGVVDAHVHINEPGRTDWEGFATATQAAAAGGVTTLVDMPLNSSPTTTTGAALEAKRAAASGKCWVDVGFHGGLIPGNADSIGPLLAAGVLGIKAFLCPSGLDEFPNVAPADLPAAAAALIRHDRPLLVHAELPNASAPRPATAQRYADYVATRPAAWELDAIGMLIEFCRTTGCRVHVVHLSSGEALPMLAAARREGLPISVETCPHYLHFSPEDVPDGATQFKCAPPFRDVEQRELLWEGLRQRVIDTVGSDHSPCPPEMKQLGSGDFMAAWGGISSLELTLPIVWTGAARRQVSLAMVFQWLSTRPAQLFGLGDRKGRIAVGCDADLVVWDPDARWQVRGEQLHQRHKLTPYGGVELQGKVCRTYLRGNLVLRDEVLAAHPVGQLLRAGRRPSEP